MGESEFAEQKSGPKPVENTGRFVEHREVVFNKPTRTPGLTGEFKTGFPATGAEATAYVGGDNRLRVKGPDNGNVYWRDATEPDPRKIGWNKFPPLKNGLHQDPVMLPRGAVEFAFRNAHKATAEVVRVTSFWGVEGQQEGIDVRRVRTIKDINNLRIFPAP